MKILKKIYQLSFVGVYITTLAVAVSALLSTSITPHLIDSYAALAVGLIRSSGLDIRGMNFIGLPFESTLILSGIATTAIIYTNIFCVILYIFYIKLNSNNSDFFDLIKIKFIVSKWTARQSMANIAFVLALATLCLSLTYVAVVSRPPITVHSSIGLAIAILVFGTSVQNFFLIMTFAVMAIYLRSKAEKP